MIKKQKGSKIFEVLALMAGKIDMDCFPNKGLT